MALVLRLKRRVVLPTIWLSRREYDMDYRKDFAALARMLDGSAETVLEDLGGFAGIADGSAWNEGEVRVCDECGRALAIAEFRMMIASHDQRLMVLRNTCRECEAGTNKSRRGALLRS